MLHVSYVLLKHISFVVVNLLLLIMRNYYLCYLLDLWWILVLEWGLWRLLEVFAVVGELLVDAVIPGFINLINFLWL
jgi:hypothetical protein